MRLSNRPLLFRGSDEALFVVRRSVTERLNQAVVASYNVLLRGERGSGKTTLLRWIAKQLKRDGRVAVLIDARGAESADEILRRLVDALVDRDILPMFSQYDIGEATSGPALAMLRRLASRLEGTTVLLDSPEDNAAYELFGRLRDSVWELGCPWVVAADPGVASVLVAQPADAFWDVHVSIPPLDVDEQRELLRRRLSGTPVPEDLINPRGTTPWKLLTAAREASLAGGVVEDIEGVVESEQRAASFGRHASMAFATLEGASEGLTAAEVARQLGYPRDEITKALRNLEHAGILEVTAEPHPKYSVTRNGRP